MLDFIDLRIVAAIQILAAIGIARFWTTWLRTEHQEPWLPTGYVEHERCFVYPDSVLAILMVVSAIGLAMSHNFWSMPILVVGLFKLGFPETFMYLYLGIFSKNGNPAARLSDLCNGIGTVLHHSAGCFNVAMLLVDASEEGFEI